MKNGFSVYMGSIAFICGLILIINAVMTIEDNEETAKHNCEALGEIAYDTVINRHLGVSRMASIAALSDSEFALDYMVTDIILGAYTTNLSAHQYKTEVIEYCGGI